MTGTPSYGQILREYGVTPKKRLGQNFMIDPALLQSIARLMVPDQGKWAALEIGAGIGTLSRQLAGRAESVTAVEMDRDLIPAIEKTCSGIENLEFVYGDALDCDLTGADLRREHPDADLILCGNLPYYATSEILYRALIPRSAWRRMAFVVQAEVGDRMAGPAGSRDFGRLSLWCQYRCRVTIPKRITRGSFVPRPTVDSCLVVMEVESGRHLSADEEDLLDRVSRAAFSQRRKTLLNTLRDLATDRESLLGAMDSAGIDPRLRAEDLGVDGFVRLTRALALVIQASN